MSLTRNRIDFFTLQVVILYDNRVITARNYSTLSVTSFWIRWLRWHEQCCIVLWKYSFNNWFSFDMNEWMLSWWLFSQFMFNLIPKVNLSTTIQRWKFTAFSWRTKCKRVMKASLLWSSTVTYVRGQNGKILSLHSRDPYYGKEARLLALFVCFASLNQ